MKVIVEVPSGLLEKIRKHIISGKFASFAEFIETALENQVAWEEESNVFKPSQVDQILKGRTATAISESKALLNAYTLEGQERGIGYRFPELGLSPEGYYEVKVVSIPNNFADKRTPLWGQYNRVLPVKLSLRFLINLLKGQQENSVELAHFRDAVADVAREFGLLLTELDKRAKKSYGERLSTAFPVQDDQYKSKERFKNQFVGYLDGRGQPHGLAAKLKLISIFNQEGQTLVGVTDPGLQFAILKNPVIDEGNPQKPFSEEEAICCLEHISRNVKGEKAAILFMLKNIKEGITRPDDLTNCLRTYGEKIGEKWNEDVAYTIRAGLVSRLQELGVIKREKVGSRKIAYHLSPFGERLLEEWENGS
jgi:Arc/MetJ-type ribon-helix-helix transcriptional regulator